MGCTDEEFEDEEDDDVSEASAAESNEEGETERKRKKKHKVSADSYAEGTYGRPCSLQQKGHLKE